MIIRKNCMEEIANIYGLKLCEDFILESDSGYTVGVFKIDKCGLWKYDKNNMCYYAWHDVINRILDGSWGVRKMTNEEIVKEAFLRSESMDAWQKALNRAKEKRNFKCYENYPEILDVYHDICEFGNIEQIKKAENILDNHRITFDLIFNGKPDSEIVYESLIDVLNNN